ncbi:hypothetical protein M9458_051307, partial [Cirrhinus mrigala]
MFIVAGDVLRNVSIRLLKSLSEPPSAAGLVSFTPRAGQIAPTALAVLQDRGYLRRNIVTRAPGKK